MDTHLKTFEELECYRAARELRRRISQIVASFPRSEEFRLSDQIIRSSRSITANIAEGFGRYHHLESAQFYRQARGSLSETLEHLNTAADEGLIGEKEYAALRELVAETWRLLNGYIAYLVRCAKDQRRSTLPKAERADKGRGKAPIDQ